MIAVGVNLQPNDNQRHLLTVGVPGGASGGVVHNIVNSIKVS
jgi:hypothetical protein